MYLARPPSKSTAVTGKTPRAFKGSSTSLGPRSAVRATTGPRSAARPAISPGAPVHDANAPLQRLSMAPTAASIDARSAGSGRPRATVATWTPLPGTRDSTRSP